MSLKPFLVLAAALSAVAHAQDSPKDPGTILKNYSADLTIPDTPGLSIVGLNSDDVIQPSTPRKLGMALLQGRGNDGSARRGYALDFAPMQVFRPATSKKEYEDSAFLIRPLWNSQVSAGVGQPVSSDDKSTRIGLGFSSVLWRSAASDPLLNKTHGKCLTDALTLALPSKPFPSAADNDQANQAATAALKDCYAKLEEKTWNASSLMVGVATSMISGRDPALLPKGRPTGYWASFGYGFDGIESLQPVLQFTATYRRLRQEIVADPDDSTKFVAQDSHLFGGKLYGRWPEVHVFVEASRQHATIPGRDAQRTNLFVFGAEKKIFDNVWLTVAMGRKQDGSDARPNYVSTGLKFGTGDALIKP